MSAYKLGSVVSAHSWNHDGTRVAVCLNEPIVKIYGNIPGNKAEQWEVEFELDRHTMVVTGIDWSKTTDRIVTCSHDLNAFVWTFNPQKKPRPAWEPKVSILRIDRAALKCRWSPNGEKFAVASASRVASICYFQRNHDWWVSKLTKKGIHKSTVLDVAWHPSSQAFATAGCDFKCRVFSAFVEEVDQAGGQTTALGDLSDLKFGTLITEFEGTGAWIEAVAWTPSGNGLAFVGHDSTISFVSFASGQAVCTLVKTAFLPFTTVSYLNEDVAVAAGYGYQPILFKSSGNNTWKQLGSADESKGKSKGPAKGRFANNLGVFAEREREGQRSTGTGVKTLHSNAITTLEVGTDGFSTSGGDGNLVVWNNATLKKAVKGF